MVDLFNPRAITLVCRDADGTDYEQMLADVPRDGTLIDPDTGDDLELALAYVAPAPTSVQPLAPESPALSFHIPVPGSCRVTWAIDSSEDVSPAKAAVNAWQQNFRRGLSQPTVDECCAFTVTDSTGASVEIDLSDAQFTHLFD